MKAFRIFTFLALTTHAAQGWAQGVFETEYFYMLPDGSWEFKGWHGPEVEDDRMQFFSVSINGGAPNNVIEVRTSEESGPSIRASDARDLGLRLSILQRGWIDVTTIAGARVTVDRELRLLTISVPDTMLLSDPLPASRTLMDRGDWAVLINYNVLRSDTANGPTKIMGSGEIVLSSPWGSIVSLGDLSQSKDGLTFGRERTYARVNDSQRLIEYRFGEFTTEDRLNRSVPIVGFGLKRDFNIEPKLEEYPAISFYREPAIGSELASVVQSLLDQVEGDQLLRETPIGVTDAQGQTVYRVFDRNGRSRLVTLSFADTSNLLKAGLADYNLSIGRAIRFTNDRPTYADLPVVDSNFRYGILDDLAITLGFSATKNYLSGRFGIAGVVLDRHSLGGRIDVSRYNDKQGFMLNGHASLQLGFGRVILAGTKRSADYWDLGMAAESGAPVPDSLTSFPTLPERELYASFVTARDGYAVSGSFGAISGVDRNEAIGLLSYSTFLGDDRSTFNASLGYNFRQSDGWISAGVKVPLGNATAASLSIEGNNGRAVSTGSLIRALGPELGDYGYKISLRTDAPQVTGTAAVRTSIGLLEVSAGKSDLGRELQVGVVGSIGLGRGGIYHGEYAADSFVMVDTVQPDIPVTKNGLVRGQTSVFGGSVLSINGYSWSSVGVQPESVASDFSSTVFQNSMILHRRSGKVLSFQLERNDGIMVSILNSNGEPIEAGNVVLLNEVDVGAIIGIDGEVWIPNGQVFDQLKVLFSDGRSCSGLVKDLSEIGRATMKCV